MSPVKSYKPPVNNKNKNNEIVKKDIKNINTKNDKVNP